MLRAPDGQALEARFACVTGSRIVDRWAVFHSITEVGPHAPDGTYARLSWDPALGADGTGNADASEKTPLVDLVSWRGSPAQLEWSRTGEETIVGRFHAPTGCRIAVFVQSPWRSRRPVFVHTGAATQGPFALLISNAPMKGSAYEGLPAAYAAARGQPSGGREGPSGPVGLLLADEDAREIGFVLTAEPKAAGPSLPAIANELERNAAAYARSRVAMHGGWLEGAAEALTQNLHWMLLARPDTGRLYLPAGRRWVFDRADGEPEDYTIFEWDGFFNALQVAVESPALAKEMLAAVLETQYGNGNIPNFRSGSFGSTDRSQPPIGSFCVLKIWGRLGRDLSLLRDAYPRLRAWHSWWRAPGPVGRPRRDENGNGLLEWGSDPIPPGKNGEPRYRTRDKARFESGMDDSPLFDDVQASAAGTLELDALDLNALYALDALCLAKMAEALGRSDEARAYYAEHEQMARLINEKLWDEREGFYFDRRFDGRLSHRKAASNFYPLLAGIVPAGRAQRIVEHLRDPRQFWGAHMLPTISRDDPAFADQQYWRGTIWPPTNYLVVQGLRRSGFEQEAAALTESGARLFLGSWRKHGLCRENYDSRTGEGGGQRFQSWGPLFVLAALEELGDYDPFRGYRFGPITTGEVSLSNVVLAGRRYTIRATSSSVQMQRDGAPWLTASGGGLFVFGLDETPARLRFGTRSASAGQLALFQEGWSLLQAGRRRVLRAGETIPVPAGTAEWTFERGPEKFP